MNYSAEQCHELAFFAFFSPYFSQHLRTPSFRFYLIILNTLVLNHFACSLSSQTIKKIKSACIQTHDVANTTLNLQRTARFQTKTNNRLSNCPEGRQDQRPPPRSANRHDRSSANLPRHHLPRSPPERSTPTGRARDRRTRQ